MHALISLAVVLSLGTVVGTRALPLSVASRPLAAAAGVSPCYDSAACSCVERPREGLALRNNTAKELQRATAVFSGVVDSVEGWGGSVRFRVTRWYKGGEGDTITVKARHRPDVWSTCELLFRPGESWLIFAHPDSAGAPRTGLCTGSRRGTEADSTLQHLGLGWRPRT